MDAAKERAMSEGLRQEIKELSAARDQLAETNSKITQDFKTMNEKVFAEVESAKRSAEERLEAVKRSYEAEKGANLMVGEQGFRLCRDQVKCVHKDLDLQPLGYFKSVVDGVLAEPDDSGSEDEAGDENGGVGNQTGARQAG